LQTFCSDNAYSDAMPRIKQFSEMVATLGINFFKVYDRVVHWIRIILQSPRNGVIINDSILHATATP